MSTSSSGSSSTNHNTNPTTAKHQLVSPEGFLRPLEVPEGVTKLVIYVGGDRDKLKEVLGVCERVNSTKNCTNLGTLDKLIRFSSHDVKYLIFNYRKGMTFTYMGSEDTYNRAIQKEEYYEVSYGLFIEKLRWAERALLFQGYMEDLG